MDFNSLTDSGADHSLPSLMYIDYSNQQPSIQLPPPTTLPSISLQNNYHLTPRKRPNKVHVSAACVNCKKAHLACDVSRPCNRCVATDKADTCKDTQHKKRGRPKMKRDENNNKIRSNNTEITIPAISNKPIHNIDANLNKSCKLDDIFMIFLSMDLCCARVSDKSLDYLELYPQEFSQRSMYDFLIPGESRHVLSKLHRYLLDNAVQYHQSKLNLPQDMIRSSSDQFFSTSLDKLLTISNGSLTLTHQMKFYHGRKKDVSDEIELNCKLYLGGGLGADLLNYTNLHRLYIVCLVEPCGQQRQERDNPYQLPPLMLKEHDITNDFLKDAITLDDEDKDSSVSMSPQQEDSPQPSSASSISSHGDHRIHLQNSTATTINTSPPPTAENTLLEKFKYQAKPASNQFIHPNELYYMKTTSSRLSSEAIAHTNFSYLSKTPSKNVTGSGPLAHYNSRYGGLS